MAIQIEGEPRPADKRTRYVYSGPNTQVEALGVDGQWYPLCVFSESGSIVPVQVLPQPLVDAGWHV